MLRDARWYLVILKIFNYYQKQSKITMNKTKDLYVKIIISRWSELSGDSAFIVKERRLRKEIILHSCQRDIRAISLLKELRNLIPPNLVVKTDKILCFKPKSVMGKTHIYPMLRDGTLAIQSELILLTCGFDQEEASRISLLWHKLLSESLLVVPEK